MFMTQPPNWPFSINLTRGIVTGFRREDPSEIRQITKLDDKLIINTQIRQDGELVPQPRKEIIASEQSPKLEELKTILEELPVDRYGVEDIYKLKTSIAFFEGNWFWWNKISTGTEGKSDVVPTDENKASFQKAIDIIEYIANAKTQ